MKKALVRSSLAVVLMALPLVACGKTTEPKSDSNVYTVSKHYDDNSVGDIPSDAVNQVMFAYSTEGVNVDFRTTLTLNKEEKTYTLYKQIETPKYTNDEGVEVQNVNAQYEFVGSYTSTSDTELTLAIPTSGKYNCYYPTVLNYQSIEKQTQDWVSSTDYPTLLTRFNKWYPAKNPSTVAQPVTLSGSTMTFGEVTFNTTPTDDGKKDTSSSSSTPTQEKVAKITAEGTNGSKLAFYEDKTYVWSRKAGNNNLSEQGTWVLNESHQIVLSFISGEETKTFTGTLGEDNSQTIEYIPYSMGGYADQLKDTFTMAVTSWGQLTTIK